VQPLDDEGTVLDAECHVEGDGQVLALILESRGGGEAGQPRHPDYNRALTTLLRRLARVDAVLVDALVDSRQTQALGLTEAARSILDEPVRLSQEPDLESLRRRMGAAQVSVGHSPESSGGGNRTKRIRLRLEVPGFSPGDAGRLEEVLGKDALAPEGHLSWPAAGEVLRSLIGEEIPTITGKPNTVLAVQGRIALVGTGRSPQGQSVEISEVQLGMDKLRANGSVRIAVEELGHRSAFVGAVLSTLPGARVTGSPATVFLGVGDPIDSREPEFAVLDSTASVKIRKEQGALRSILSGGRELADCALCGHEYPLKFRVAAHIKKRSVCTDDERRDLRHIAMLACTFGCDALYEAGWITVGPDGRIQPIPIGVAPTGRLLDHLQLLAGRHCRAHNEASEPYFKWHRETYSPSVP
jgi:hypothetical protein